MTHCGSEAMAVSEHTCNDYFSSLGHLSRRILIEQEVLRSMHAWEAMSDSDRDKLLDSYFIHLNVEKKLCPSSNDDLDEPKTDENTFFPRYRIKSGEKIVIDFENGCWTWEDEHSGPFSWESKAQREQNPFEVDIKSFKRKSKIPREKIPSTSDDKGSFPWNPNKSIWDSPFLRADGGGNPETLGFADLFQDMGGLSLSPTAERCESPPLPAGELQFDGEQVPEAAVELEAFCALDKSEKSSHAGDNQSDDGQLSLDDYIEIADPDPDPPVIKLRSPFSIKKVYQHPMVSAESSAHLATSDAPSKDTPPYAVTRINRSASQRSAISTRNGSKDNHYPLYEPEPIPQPRVYRKQAPKKTGKIPPLEEKCDIYEPVMVAGNAMALPYEVVDLEQLNIESLPLPDDDAGNEYYQSFDDATALTKNELGNQSLSENLPAPDYRALGDLDDHVITEQPGLDESNDERVGLLVANNSSPVKTGFSFLDDW